MLARLRASATTAMSLPRRAAMGVAHVTVGSPGQRWNAKTLPA
jgi:hypothetical protein